MKNELVMDGIQPVFLVGPPRSGTTLVQLLISAHPAFFSAPETHFFTYVLEPIKDWTHSKLSLEQLDVVFEQLAAKPMLKLGEDFQSYIRQKADIDGIAPSAFLNELMVYLGNSGKESIRWVEKTPRHALCIPQILTMFPGAKVVAVVRDPRDVASSPSPFGRFDSKIQLKKYRLSRAELWNRIVKTVIQLMPNDHILIIRYEDIVEDPLLSLDKIMRFLGEESYPATLDTFSDNYEQVVLPEENQHKKLCSTGQIVDRRGIWKTRMSLEEARLVETICEPLMVEFGYLPWMSSGLAAFRKRLVLDFEKERIELTLRWQTAPRTFLVAPKKLLERIVRSLRAS